MNLCNNGDSSDSSDNSESSDSSDSSENSNTKNSLAKFNVNVLPETYLPSYVTVVTVAVVIVVIGTYVSINNLTPWQPMKCSHGSFLRYSHCFGF